MNTQQDDMKLKTLLLDEQRKKRLSHVKIKQALF